MKNFRVWQGSSTLRSGNYEDVKGKDFSTVAQRFFGKSQEMRIQHDDNGTASVTTNGTVKGYIREL